MKKTTAFTPSVLDKLEERMVLSHMMPAHHVHQAFAVSPVQNPLNPQITQAFQTFLASYDNNANTILFAGQVTKGGTANLSANRAAFDKAVTYDVAVLANTVTSIVATQPGAENSLTNSVNLSLQNERTTLSLAGQLRKIATPVGSINSTYDFLNNATNLITIGRNDVIHKNNFFLANPNFNFNGHSTFSAFTY